MDPTPVTGTSQGLSAKLQQDGFDPETCSTEEKVVYVWQLYVQSEMELSSALEQLQLAKQIQANELAEVELYVEQIRALSDEREAFTLEFERENSAVKEEITALKHQLEQEKQEISEMLCQQGLEDITSTSLPEQVAFLLVERAKLLDALDQQLDIALVSDLNAELQTSTNVHGGQFSVDSAVESPYSSAAHFHYQEESMKSSQEVRVCSKCLDLEKQREILSSKLVTAEEQVRSLERRVQRFKSLLHGEQTTPSGSEDDIEIVREKLAERTAEVLSLNERNIALSAKLNEARVQQQKEVETLQLELEALRSSSRAPNLQREEALLSQINSLQADGENLQEQLLQQATLHNELCMQHAQSFNELQQRYDQLLADEETLKDHNENLSREQQIISEKLAASLSENTRLREKNKLLNDDCEKELTALHDQYESLRGTFTQLGEEHAELAKSLGRETTEKEELRQQLENMKEEKRGRIFNKEQFEAELQALRAELAKERLSARRDAEERIDLENQLQELEEDNFRLAESVRQLNAQCESLATSHQSVFSQLNEKESDKESLTVQLCKTEQLYKNQTLDYEALLAIRESLTDQYDRLLESHKVLSRENDQLKEKQKMLGEQEEELKSRQTLLCEQNEELKIDLKSSTESNEKLQASNLALLEQIMRLQATQESLTSLRDEQIGTYNTLSNKHEELLVSQNSLSTAYNELQTSFDALNAKHEFLTAAHAQQIESYESLNYLYQTLIDETQSKPEEAPNLASHEFHCGSGEKDNDCVDGSLLSRQTESAESVEVLEKRLAQSQAELEIVRKERDLAKMQWETQSSQSLATSQSGRTSELTERVILLEKAAGQLEYDNTELAYKLREALSRNEALEFTFTQESQQLKVMNLRLTEQIDRLKKYSETLEKEIEALQEKLRQQAQHMQGGSEIKENEILSLKTDIAQLRLDHRKEIDSLQQKLEQGAMENTILRGNLIAKSEELSSVESLKLETQRCLEKEGNKWRSVEMRNEQLEQEVTKACERMKEANERKSIIEKENQRLAAELRELTLTSKENLLVQHMADTDSNKVLELAESRIQSLEQQREELRTSLQHVTSELDRTSQTLVGLEGVQSDLQFRKEELLRLKAQLNDEQLKRSLEEKKVEELKQSLASMKERESKTQEQSHQLRHKLLDAEAKMAQLQADNKSLHEEMVSAEIKFKSLTQRLVNQNQENETLDLELLASNEKFQALNRKYQDRKTRYRNKLQTNRMLYEMETKKLNEKVESMERELRYGKSALEQEGALRGQVEIKYHTLMEEKRSLLAKIVDIEDDVRERNRGISLLQTKLTYTEKELRQLQDVIAKLKLGQGSQTDLPLYHLGSMGFSGDSPRPSQYPRVAI